MTAKLEFRAKRPGHSGKKSSVYTARIVEKFGGVPPADCRDCVWRMSCNPNGAEPLRCELADAQADVNPNVIPVMDIWLNATHEELRVPPKDPLGGQDWFFEDGTQRRRWVSESRIIESVRG